MKKEFKVGSFLMAMCAMIFTSCEEKEGGAIISGSASGGTCMVTFNSGGGTEVPSQEVKSGELVQKPEDPVKENFVFVGWYKEAEGINLWDFATEKVTQNLTLYAKWGTVAQWKMVDKKLGKTLGDIPDAQNNALYIIFEVGLTDADMSESGRYANGEDMGKNPGEIKAYYDTEQTTLYVGTTKDFIQLSDSLFYGSQHGFFQDFTNVAKIRNLHFLRTEKVTSMRSMFYDCHALDSLDFSSFNTNNVTDMRHMFCNCVALITPLDLSNFNTSNVTDMNHMFYRCESLTSLDLSNFNTSNVTDMNYMFEECSSLGSLDLSRFNTGNVTSMSRMFCECSKLQSLTLSDNFVMTKVTSKDYMFSSCGSHSGKCVVKEVKDTNVKNALQDGTSWSYSYMQFE